MKICLYLQRNFAPVGDAIATILNEKYGVEEFCGFVSTRNALDVLKNGSSIKYTSLLLDEDIHNKYKEEKIDHAFLQNFEKEYGLPNAWPYLSVDRTLMYGLPLREYPHNTPPWNHEEMLRILQVTAKEIIAFLKKEKPDLIFFSLIGSTGSMLLYHIAKKMGIKTFVVSHGLIENRILISSRHDYFSLKGELPENDFKNISTEYQNEAKKFLESFRSKPRPYFSDFTPDKQPVNRSKQLRFLYPGNLIRFIKAIYLEFYLYYKKGQNRNDYLIVKPWYFLLDRIKRKIRNIIGLNDFYDNINPKEDFAYFPLQYEPEISLLVQAPFWVNQKEAIRQVARSLPIGWKLYVKEHPQMVEYRPRSFYKELKKIPNVKIINPSIKSFGLIQGSKLVTAITDTGGWEACLLKKPVVMLGNHFCNDLSFVKHCDNPEKLPEIIKDQVENFKFNEQELLNYISLIIKESVKVELNRIWNDEKDPQKKKNGIAPLADLLAKKLGLNTKS